MMALNVVCGETAIRLKSGAKRKLLASAQNVIDDPKRASLRLRIGAASNGCRLIDYFVGADKKRVRYGQPKRLGGLEIKHEFEFRRLLDREFRGLCAFQYFVGIGRRAAKIIGDVLPI